MNETKNLHTQRTTMVGARGRPRKNTETQENERGNVTKSEYEESRAQRIKENAERMKTLGLFDLSKNLKPRSSPSKLPRKAKPAHAPSNDPPRRSSRSVNRNLHCCLALMILPFSHFLLKDLPPVSYVEKKTPSKKTMVENVEIHIEEGENPEIYTEEHKKLLGDSEHVWELYVDGYDEDGQRIYDPVNGKSCHQCRQKTLGFHTKCSKCEAVSGQFCGDCLYMRYGENVKEVNQNSEWVCPTCRGICNCSRCRREKGWMPTGAIYNKVSKLGFKSVAHYLIQTRNEHAVQEEATDNLVSAAKSLPVGTGKDKSGLSLGGGKNEGEKVVVELDSDEDYRGDNYEDDDGDDGSISENDTLSVN
ncbi:zinc-finger domain of monoamine-oxidase Arepressor R1 [Striga asiatica]|uniref:Zinc-finger domain of monoamine-oxidase Arepressor R1 n=1 Tax=Striga asiatica TaxID=4170 RepID=A0A5A7QVE9_STRAF|nr:zinc-finger domain of monoamine-oxidase Arepressor R1 [Striga asiatica]